MTDHEETARRWSAAFARAAGLAGRCGAVDETSWDEVAIRDTIAVTVYGLAASGGVPVEEVGWDAVLWQLQYADRVRALLDPLVPAEDADGRAEGLAARWAWLERVWDPDAPFAADLADLEHNRSARGLAPGDRIEARWCGMTRGIARGLPDPALEVALLHAAGAVSARLLAECAGLADYARVAVSAGAYAGDAGYVGGPVWVLDDERETVATPPYGYKVLLDHDTAIPAPVIEAAHLRAADDGLAWPRRPAETSNLLPPVDTPVPEPSSGQMLDSLLVRSTNAHIVPGALRAEITGGAGFTSRLIEHRASPRPMRCTWRAVEHAFVSEERAGGVVSVFEVEFTRSVMDRDPVFVLALDESEILPLIAAHLHER